MLLQKDSVVMQAICSLPRLKLLSSDCASDETLNQQAGLQQRIYTRLCDLQASSRLQ